MSEKHVSTREAADPIMTLQEIAHYLKVSEKTILRMVQGGKLPGLKVSNQWRFVRDVVDQWLSDRMRAESTNNLLAVIGEAPHILPITRLVFPQRIVMDIVPGEKRAVLEQLVAPLTAGGLIDDPRDYVNRLLEREETVSTGIGQGLAIPHVREPRECAVEPPCIVIGICAQGADYGALDGRKTCVFAMPCSAVETVHLRLLAKLTLIFRRPGVLKQMTEARTKKTIMEVLTIADSEGNDS